MKKVFLITYDLKKPVQDYAPLYQAIKDIGDWSHPLESTWAVKLDNGNSNKLFEILRKFIDDNDSLFIVEITSDRQGWMPKTFWNWIKD